MARGSRVAGIAAFSLLLAAIVLVALPRGFEPTAKAIATATKQRDGFEWRDGTFGGVATPESSPTTVTIDGRKIPTTSDFTLRRALMRRSVFSFRAKLRLLELPEWDAWNDYRGSKARYELSTVSGRVSRVIVIEQPR